MVSKNNVAIKACQFEKEHSSCLSCNKTIQQPICPKCISKWFREWSRKSPELSELNREIKKFLKAHKSLARDSSSCAVCGDKVHICPYCFTEYLYNRVKEAGAGVTTLTEFRS